MHGKVSLVMDFLLWWVKTIDRAIILLAMFCFFGQLIEIVNKFCFSSDKCIKTNCMAEVS